jgi:hypothetical protein
MWVTGFPVEELAMHCLMTLETTKDLITTCRLLNILRRKGVSVVKLVVAARPEGFLVRALVDGAAEKVEHIFNLLRCTPAIRHVTCHPCDQCGDRPFTFVDGGADVSGRADLPLAEGSV